MINYTELLPHQQAAVEKISKIKIGALYMDMGTGKTRTALELIKIRLDAGKVNKIIWLCPCSVKKNLYNDIKYHSDIADSNILIICGIETLSTSIKWNLKLQSIAEENNAFLIVDESTLVKNPFALRSRNITRLAGKCQYKLILSGTPITKNEADLYSQWYLLDSRILGYKSYYSFAANHLEYDDKGKIRRTLNVDYLTRKIAPYTYQCDKKDCIVLPDKRYKTYYFNITPEQSEEYYRAVDVYLSADILDTREGEAAIYRAFNALQQITTGRKIVKYFPTEHIPFFKNTEDNPRIEALLEMVEKLPDEKIVIWCKYTHEIEDIKTILNKLGESVSVVCGNYNLKKRQQEIENFKKSNRILVANKGCAGFGLNLQYCHNAIYYNNNWDWETRIQSEDRLYRIGQNHDVNIIDIVANNKIDERIINCLWRKDSLAGSFKRHLNEHNEMNLKSWIDGKEEIS